MFLENEPPLDNFFGLGETGWASLLGFIQLLNNLQGAIMAKIYQGKVSVFANSNNQLVVKPDDSGNFSHENISELYKTMLALGKKHKMEVRVFKPEQGGDTPVLMTDRWGKPYVALLPERKAPGMVKVTVQKLA
jgi:hypothetical protein